ncbi:MAG: sigma-70 family RNA polymerase sigma factor [Thermoguttaceae bacterium]|nr:sigma-70 family RNA polymerase sigma factor [Thermoguttaceae bacterium]MBQ5788952.1 sigma-70 family RNA polymerase sigma factor [Thermoguttaceae bacterium]
MEALKRQDLIVAAKRLVSKRDRVLSALRWVDGLTDAEIAAATGMTVATVAERLAVVERTLRERLKGDFANA